jgi:hypothetical protein
MNGNFTWHGLAIKYSEYKAISESTTIMEVV